MRAGSAMLVAEDGTVEKMSPRAPCVHPGIGSVATS